MKKAFTFAELMISLVIIAVLTALLYPTVSELAPNNNKHLFKTTFKTISLVVDEIMNEQNETGTGNACTGVAITDTTDADGNITVTAGSKAIQNQHDLCCQFNNRLSTAGTNNCDGNNQLRTSNGVRWWFSAANTLYVDVNASNNNIASQCAGTNAVWATGSFCDNDAIRDTFLIVIDSTGRIIAKSGENHLRNESDD